MAKYVVTATRTADNTLLVGAVIGPGAAARRIKLYELIVGVTGAPADNAFLWRVLRTNTAAGTSTGATPNPIDPADAAALMSGGSNFTVNPTLGVTLLDIPLNQRATIRWVAAQGAELIAPTTVLNGLGVQTPTMTALTVNATIYVEEQ